MHTTHTYHVHITYLPHTYHVHITYLPSTYYVHITYMPTFFNNKNSHLHFIITYIPRNVTSSTGHGKLNFLQHLDLSGYFRRINYKNVAIKYVKYDIYKDYSTNVDIHIVTNKRTEFFEKLKDRFIKLYGPHHSTNNMVNFDFLFWFHSNTNIPNTYVYLYVIKGVKIKRSRYKYKKDQRKKKLKNKTNLSIRN